MRTAGISAGKLWSSLVAGALLSLSPSAATAENQTVAMKSARFEPATVTVAPGDNVVWKDETGGHSVTFDDGSYDQPAGCAPSLLGPVGCTQAGDELSRTFPQAGEYGYHCKIHGQPGAGMAGVVVVEDSSSAGATATTAPEPEVAAGATTTTTTTTTTSSTTTTTIEQPATTTTTRALATSSTMATATTTAAAETATTRIPLEAPVFDPDDGVPGSEEAAGRAGGDNGAGMVAVVVALLLAVAAAGGFLLWRLRPGRSA